MANNEKIHKLFERTLKSDSKKFERVIGVYWHHSGNSGNPNEDGGEIYLRKNGVWHLVSQVHPIKVLCDKSPIEYPSIATLCAMWPSSPGKVWIRKRFNEYEIEKINDELQNTECTSNSVFLLCNAVLGLLNGRQKVSSLFDSMYKLQNIALSALNKTHAPYCIGKTEGYFDPSYLLEMINRDKKNQEHPGNLAHRFYQTLAQWILYIATSEETEAIVATGCVFNQNVLLKIIEQLMPPHLAFYSQPKVEFIKEKAHI